MCVTTSPILCFCCHRCRSKLFFFSVLCHTAPPPVRSHALLPDLEKAADHAAFLNYFHLAQQTAKWVNLRWVWLVKLSRRAGFRDDDDDDGSPESVYLSSGTCWDYLVASLLSLDARMATFVKYLANLNRITCPEGIEYCRHEMLVSTLYILRNPDFPIKDLKTLFAQTPVHTHRLLWDV